MDLTQINDHESIHLYNIVSTDLTNGILPFSLTHVTTATKDTSFLPSEKVGPPCHTSHWCIPALLKFHVFWKYRHVLAFDFNKIDDASKLVAH